MVELFHNYYDKNGKMLKPIAFSNGQYLCEYKNGKKLYLQSHDIFDKVELNLDKAITPVYFKDKIIEKTDTKVIKLKDKAGFEEEKKEVEAFCEDAEEDFYIDL